ncbi:MAG: ubiquinol-cytochrome C chaperone [Alphaproteobacteria bacterium]|nr:ubiquinol-cytochrome C chaperone [Alphaproteobacteria bacterium]
MILRLFRKDPRREAAETLYGEIVAAARRPAPFVDLGVEDSVEGRYEMLAAHVFLALRRLKADGDAARPVSQALFDVFFRNMDDQLREMGVGDLTVGKKIRALAEGFYGRMGAYDAALAAADKDALAGAIARNILARETADESARRLADYFVAADAALKGQDLATIAAGAIEFPPYDRDAAA